jgi:hypothetical protein
MDTRHDDAYLRYVVARFAALRNIWWTLANEFDVFPKPKDWRHLGELLAQIDPYGHLRGIHKCYTDFYDNSQSWITHVILRTSLPSGGPLHRATIPPYRSMPGGLGSPSWSTNTAMKGTTAWCGAILGPARQWKCTGRRSHAPPHAVQATCPDSYKPPADTGNRPRTGERRSAILTACMEPRPGTLGSVSQSATYG